MAGKANKGKKTALLIIDMINPFDFEHGEKLFANALRAAPKLAALKKKTQAARQAVIYVNDNFMDWRRDFRALVDRCSGERAISAPITRLLAPQPGDYFILKPRHSGFYATPLEFLLERLAVRRLLLTGVATDGCILATAADAHIREFDLLVPADCTAAVTAARKRQALAIMQGALKADVRPSG